MRLEVPHPTAGTLPLVASPLNLPTAPPQVRYPPPLLGQHSTEILQEVLNCDPATIDALRAGAVI
jgi:crotonobetainyl-CoA:carnitine CoA-transferase CaiB-like acyl-CoA transferase